MRRSGCWMLVSVVACLAPACGDEAPPEPDYFIGASAEWSRSAPTPDALGYTVAVLLQQARFGHPDDPCRPAPASTRFTVNGAEVPLMRDPETGCVVVEFLSAPVLGPLVVTARVEEEGRLVGEAVFNQLMPGTSATLVSPADGRVSAGSEILIVPPAALPTDVPSFVTYYPLDPGGWVPDGIASREAHERRLDGIHIVAPAFSGPTVLIMTGMPSYIPPDVVCPGFAGCTEIVEVTLGPFMLTGGP